LPVDVIEAERGDLPAAKPEPNKQDHDRVVPAAQRRAAIAACQDRLDVGVGDPPGKSEPAPSGHRQRGLGQVGAGQAFQEAEAQERPQPEDEVLGRGDRHRRGNPQHCRRHLSRGDLGQPGRQPGQEPPGLVQVAGDGPGGQAALGHQIPLEGGEQSVCSRNRPRSRPGCHAGRAKDLQQAQ
jgi:hypothetical protein